jgi:hypothetical protein
MFRIHRGNFPPKIPPETKKGEPEGSPVLKKFPEAIRR